MPAPPGRALPPSTPYAPPPPPPPAGRSAPYGLFAPGAGREDCPRPAPSAPTPPWCYACGRGSVAAVVPVGAPVSGSASLLGSPAPSCVQSTRAATSARGRAVGVRSSGGKLPPPPSLPPTARPCPLLGPARPVVDPGLSVGPSRRLRAVVGGRQPPPPTAQHPRYLRSLGAATSARTNRPAPPQPHDRVPRLNPFNPTLALTGVRSPDRICRRRYTGTTPPDSPPAPTTG